MFQNNGQDWLSCQGIGCQTVITITRMCYRLANMSIYQKQHLHSKYPKLTTNTAGVDALKCTRLKYQVHMQLVITYMGSIRVLMDLQELMGYIGYHLPLPLLILYQQQPLRHTQSLSKHYFNNVVTVSIMGGRCLKHCF